MTEIPAKPWLVAGFVQMGIAAVAGVLVAAGFAASPLDLLLAGAGVVLVACGLAYGYAPPFLKREALGAWPAHAALGLVLLANPLALLGPRWAASAAGAGFLLVPLHLAASAAWGKPWRDGVALFAKDQPYRRGDRIAAAAFALALAALAAAGALLLAPPRGLLTTGLAVLLLGFALPFHAGALVFLLPRNAKTPLAGATLVVASLGVGALAAAGLAAAFAFPLQGDFRSPAWAALLADVLMVAALARLRPESPGAQWRRARPFLRGAAALALLAGLGLALAMAGGLPGPLLRPAAYAHAALAGLLATAAALLAAPVLVNSVPREGGWGKVAAAGAIAGVLVAAYAPFVGALVLAAATGLVLWGLAPMRTPRRACG
ncbi:MAG TPA: hypothetical protein VNX21_02520 [Candidatus Thermoplasmatota archaeon]|nr:hypothetical protein [Candidatus Thermoplasmatota archaeon]